jgi:hypothetical protein
MPGFAGFLRIGIARRSAILSALARCVVAQTNSVRQPWASLIVSGAKDVENRTWPTRYRGSLKVDDTSSEDIEGRYGVRLPAELPLGGIVGMT